MKLSVIILNYNVRHFLELCLKSVEAALVHIDAEIIVVDNQSTDDSCEMVKALFPHIKLIENKENFGFSKGNNIAVAQATGDYICILNPDTVVAEDSFEILLKFSEKNPNAGIVGCRLIDGHGQFLPESKRNIPTPFIAIKKMLGLSRSYYVSDLKETGTASVPVFVGAFMFMKSAVYNEVKGFDEDYFMYGEDVDLSYKVLQAGYQNIYYGSTSIIHYKGESTLKDLTYAKRFYGAMQIFYDKHFNSNKIFNVMVWLGIRLARWFSKPPESKKSNPEKIVLISEVNNKAIEIAVGLELKVVSHIETYQNNTEYILDNNYLNFKSIIEILSNTPKNCTATFKILPKNSNFIVGSNDSKSRGEVIPFAIN